MATREAACHCGQLRLEVDGRAVRRLHLQLPRLPAPDRKRLRDAGGLQGGSGAGRPAASATTRESRTRRTGRSTSSTSAPTAARRSSTPSRRSRTWSSSRSARSPTRRSRRRRSRATTRGGTRGWGCPTRSSATPPELWETVRPLYDAGRYAEAADRGRELIEAHPEQGHLSTTSRAARASRAGRPTRSSTSAGDRAVGRRPRPWRARTPTSTRSATSPRSAN